MTQTERERESVNTFRETYDDTVTGVKQSSDNMKESLLLADFSVLTCFTLSFNMFKSTDDLECQVEPRKKREPEYF